MPVPPRATGSQHSSTSPRSGSASEPAWRGGLLAQARGEVLEIGAGTGLNLQHYPSGTDRLVLCEPDDHMARHLPRRAGRSEHRPEVVHAPAEALPFEDDSFDTVVSTLVLCTVGAPDVPWRRWRVLRPGGSLLFVEHVRSDDVRLARWQDRLAKPWRAFAAGCRCDQATLELIGGGYDVDVTERGPWRRMPPIVRPLVAGRWTGAAARRALDGSTGSSTDGPRSGRYRGRPVQ